MNQETLKQAKEELEAICNKYNIVLMPVVVHQGNRTMSSIEIFPRPDTNGQESAEMQAE